MRREAPAPAPAPAPGHASASDRGVITYTQWLNGEGKMEADVTVIRRPPPPGDSGAELGQSRFLVIATDTAHRHVEAWMRRQFSALNAEDAAVRTPGAPPLDVAVSDVTDGYAQLNVQVRRSAL